MPVPSSPARAYSLRGRLLLLVCVLVALVLASGAGTIMTAISSERAILAAHELEVISREAALLSVVAREQYIHEAHTIILRDRSHVGHHDEWVEKLQAELAELSPYVDGPGAARLTAIGAASRDVSRIFADRILPAIDRGDSEEVRRAHDLANERVDRMTEHADALAGYFDARALEAEREAAHIVRVALALSAAIGVIAAILALIAGRSLWRAFSMPLASLERVAEQVAAGDRRARVEPVGAVELAIVASAFNRMLDALGRAEAEVVHSERLAAIGRIAAGVAHEINNPIAVIRGYLKTMRGEVDSPELLDELRILDEEASVCQRIAEDLLTYARSPAMEPAPVQAEELLSEAAERAVSVPVRESASGAPPVEVEAEPALIAVDPLRIRQVIMNLVTNAREATPGPDPVLLRGRRAGDGYEIEVLDRGKGIPDETRERLFEPFFTQRRGGTGLGLAVCYGLVTAHGGSIHAEPREGGGARFAVRLPGVVVDEQAD